MRRALVRVALALLPLAGCSTEGPSRDRPPVARSAAPADRTEAPSGADTTELVFELAAPATPSDAAEVARVLLARAHLAEPLRAVQLTEDGDRIAIAFAGTLTPRQVEDLNQRLIEPGDLWLAIQAEPGDPEGFDPAQERERVAAWLGADATRVPAAYPQPTAGVAWRWTHPDHRPGNRTLIPLRVFEAPEWTFRTADLESSTAAVDSIGAPAIAFRLKTERRQAFSDFTAHHVQRDLAAVYDHQVVTLATIAERLPGVGILRGPWDEGDVARVVAAFDGGALPLPVRAIETRRR